MQVWAFAIAAFSFALRLIFSSQIELLPEEAYYWNYSRHLDFGYLDHPPMVAWLIRLGTAAAGSNEFGVRAGALACGLLASVFAYRLAFNLFGSIAGLYALIVVQTLPFFFLAGMLMTPDAPLTAAWAALLYFLERALIADRASAWKWAGVCLGLGLLSKYTIALAGFSVLLFVVVNPSGRPWLARREPYMAVLIAAAIFAPVIFWNFEHDWASFAFQTSRRLLQKPRFALHELVGSAIVLITPVGCLTVVEMLRRRPAIAATREDDALLMRRWRVLRYWVLAPLAVFALFSLRHEVKVDWTGAPWVAAIPLMAVALAGWRDQEASGIKSRLAAAWPPTIAFLLITYVVGFCYLARGLPGVGYSEHMELAPVGWRELGRQISVIARDVEGHSGAGLLIVGMDRYETASELAFHAADHVKSVERTSAGHLLGGVGLMYENWFPARSQMAATLLLVSWNERDLAGSRIEPYFDRLGPVRMSTLARDGHFIRSYFYRVGYGYRPTPGTHGAAPDARGAARGTHGAAPDARGAKPGAHEAAS